MWSRETRIRRDRHGVWFDGEEPIDQAAIARAFDAWIDVADDGRLCLRNSVNWAYVSVEGAPVFVRQARRDGDVILLQLSDGRTEALDPMTLAIDPEGALHCRVRAGALWARFDHAAAIALAEHIEEGEAGPQLVLGRSARFGFARIAAL